MLEQEDSIDKSDAASSWSRTKQTLYLSCYSSHAFILHWQINSQRWTDLDSHENLGGLDHCL